MSGGNYSAGIGGNSGESSGNIIINGGTIKATGGQFAAGIGGNDGSGGIISINNGVLSVAGGSYGAAIGGGWEGSGGIININNGTVTAVASYGGAAIGGGKASYANLPGEGDGCMININGYVSIQPTPTLSNSTKAAEIEINAKTLDIAFSVSVENTAGINIVGIYLPKVSGALTYETTLPANALIEDAGKAMEIKTEFGTVIVPCNMLAKEFLGNSNNVTIAIGKADTSKVPTDILSKIGDRPVIELSLKLDGKAISWNNQNTPVTVSIPYTPTAEELKDPEHIVVWYIDSTGNIITLPSGRYDQSKGYVTFTTTHFSNYAIAYVQKTFLDIEKYEWAKNQIEVLASKEIINGISKDIFSPGAKITRADYIVLLVNTLGLTADFDSNFDDVSTESYYYKAVGIAQKRGIATGSGYNLFSPKDYITRQDMMVLTSRALVKFKGLDNSSEYNELDKFRDKSDISEYALDSMSTLISEELIVGSGETIKPRANTTRAEAAVFLYRLYNKY